MSRVGQLLPPILYEVYDMIHGGLVILGFVSSPLLPAFSVHKLRHLAGEVGAEGVTHQRDEALKWQDDVVVDSIAVVQGE